MRYATAGEIALVSWREVSREGDFVKCRRGTGETGWWHHHKGDADYGGNPMDDIKGILTCRACGTMWIAGPSQRRRVEQ
jgi:hypothetical protein